MGEFQMIPTSFGAIPSENTAIFPVQEPRKIYNLGGFYENRTYQETESHWGILKCQRPHRRGLHPRYQAEKAAAGIRSQIPGAVPADRWWRARGPAVRDRQEPDQHPADSSVQRGAQKKRKRVSYAQRNVLIPVVIVRGQQENILLPP